VDRLLHRNSREWQQLVEVGDEALMAIGAFQFASWLLTKVVGTYVGLFSCLSGNFDLLAQPPFSSNT
jgi:hypothetical protein